MALDTGQGATITFGTSSFTALYKEFGELDQQGGSLDITALSTTGANKKMPQDNYDGGKRVCILYFDPEDGLPDLHSPETITITYPVSASGNTAATEAGTGWVVRRKFPKLANNEVQMAEIEIEWQTAPTFTAES